MDQNGPLSRRTVLKSIGSSGLILGATGIASSKTKRDENNTVSEGNSIKLDEVGFISKNEFENQIQDMASTGSRSDLNTQSISTTSQTPETSDLDFVAAWNDSYTVNAIAGWKVADTSHSLVCYRSNQTDSSGRYLYFFWHWSQAESNDDYWHPEGEIKLIESGLDSNTDAQELTDFSPNSVSTVNGQYVTAGLTLGISGATVGVTGEVWVEDGSFGPKTDGVVMGESGKHYTELDLNNLTGAHTLNATTVIRSEYKYEDDFPAGVEWNTRVVGNP